MFVALILFLYVTSISSRSSGQVHPLSDEFIEKINSHESTWRAKRNIHPDTPKERIKNFGGSYVAGYLYLDDEVDGDDDYIDEDYEDYDYSDDDNKDDANNRDFVNRKIYKSSTEGYSKYEPDISTIYHLVNESIPVFFDARDRWPHCPSIRQIRDQSVCGSCWAFATTEIITDRICIHSDGASNPEISAEDLMTCCSWSCSPLGDGCNGGSTIKALQYWVNNGISTGGGYGTNDGCRRYSFISCEDDYGKENRTRPLCPGYQVNAPSCIRACDDGVQDAYERTLHFGENIYGIANDVQQIQLEILNNGPVIANFLVYEDFLHYHHGIYRYLLGEEVSFHAIKIIGWGVEKEVPYWLVANSYNEEWGESGFFRILRGTNECFIEEFVFGGIPKLTT